MIRYENTVTEFASYWYNFVVSSAMADGQCKVEIVDDTAIVGNHIVKLRTGRKARNGRVESLHNGHSRPLSFHDTSSMHCNRPSSMYDLPISNSGFFGENLLSALANDQMSNLKVCFR